MNDPQQHLPPIPLEERIIFALDVADFSSAEALIERLAGPIRFFKVGLQLFFAAGWPVVEAITSRGCKVMLDLKLYDIPETVRLAVRQFADRGITFTTVHASVPVMEAALSAGAGVGILAVTVLTSSGEAELKALRYPGTIAELVQERAHDALHLGCVGVVASAQEAAMLRQRFGRTMGQNFRIVTPGIRPIGAASNDQQRICTPGEALLNGADYLVIGRPIRDAADPLAAIAAIQEEMQSALAGNQLQS